MYKFTDPNGRTCNGFQYSLPKNDIPGKWVKAPNPAKKDGESCGAGRLHLMQNVWPLYAPGNYRCFEAEGEGMVGGDNEKKAYHKVRLLRELLPTEIDQGIDKVFAEKLGKPNIFLPIAWMRTATFLDRPVDEVWLSDNLLPLMKILGKKGSVRIYGDSLWASLGDSLRASLGDSLGDSLRASLWASLRASLGASLGDSLRDSLWDSLWDSLFYERGFALAEKPKPELERLLEAWKAGVAVFGFDKEENLLCVAYLVPHCPRELK